MFCSFPDCLAVRHSSSFGVSGWPQYLMLILGQTLQSDERCCARLCKCHYTFWDQYGIAEWLLRSKQSFCFSTNLGMIFEICRVWCRMIRLWFIVWTTERGPLELQDSEDENDGGPLVSTGTVGPVGLTVVLNDAENHMYLVIPYAQDVVCRCVVMVEIHPLTLGKIPQK